MTALGPFAAVLLDLDGTLLDSTPAIERSWAQWARDFGVEGFNMAAAHGIPAARTVERLLGAERVAEGLARINALEMSDTDGIVALPGGLATLRTLGERCAIVTSGHLELATLRLAAAGLPTPPVLITSDLVRRGKPDPEPYLLAAETLGIDPRHCLVVEDAASGVAAGRAAGCTVLGLRTTEPNLDAHALVDDLAALTWHVGADGVRFS